MQLEVSPLGRFPQETVVCKGKLNAGLEHLFRMVGLPLSPKPLTVAEALTVGLVAPPSLLTVSFAPMPLTSLRLTNTKCPCAGLWNLGPVPTRICTCTRTPLRIQNFPCPSF